MADERRQADKPVVVQAEEVGQLTLKVADPSSIAAAGRPIIDPTRTREWLQPASETDPAGELAVKEAGREVDDAGSRPGPFAPAKRPVPDTTVFVVTVLAVPATGACLRRPRSEW